MSPQYHVVFDDEFTTVRYMEEGTVPPNWADLVEYSSEHANSQDYKLAETWLNYSNRSPNSSPADNPVVDPFAIVTHDHNQGNRNGMQSRKYRPRNQSVRLIMTLPNPRQIPRESIPVINTILPRARMT